MAPPYTTNWRESTFVEACAALGLGAIPLAKSDEPKPTLEFYPGTSQDVEDECISRH